MPSNIDMELRPDDRSLRMAILSKKQPPAKHSTGRLRQLNAVVTAKGDKILKDAGQNHEKGAEPALWRPLRPNDSL